MRTKLPFLAAIVLILASLACGPARTPTPDSGEMGASVAQTVEAQLTSAAPAQPSATPSPAVTETPIPATDTPSPSPSPPPDTPTSPPSSTPIQSTPNPPTAAPTATPLSCAIDVAPALADRLEAQPGALTNLGCPTDQAQETWAAEQVFQHGRMFWQQDGATIHILFHADGENRTGDYRIEPDMYVEGDPADVCPEVGQPSAGLFKPVRGFNWHWCKTSTVRDRLGWAVAEEQGYVAVWQPFENGHIFQSLGGHVFIFYNDGAWGYVE